MYSSVSYTAVSILHHLVHLFRRLVRTYTCISPCVDLIWRESSLLALLSRGLLCETSDMDFRRLLKRRPVLRSFETSSHLHSILNRHYATSYAAIISHTCNAALSPYKHTKRSPFPQPQCNSITSLLNIITPPSYPQYHCPTPDRSTKTPSNTDWHAHSQRCRLPS